MFAEKYRFQIYNDTGVATDATDVTTINARRWYLGSDAAINYEGTESTVFNGGASLSDATAESGSTLTNSLYFGGVFEVSAEVTTATPAGNIEVWYQVSTDGGSTWPDDRQGELVASLYFDATGTKRGQFEI